MDITALIISVIALIVTIITACAAHKSATAAKLSAHAAQRNIEIAEIIHIRDMLKPCYGNATFKEKLKELRDKTDKETLIMAMESAVREKERVTEQIKDRIGEYTEIILHQE